MIAWYYSDGTSKHGPVSPADLKRLAQRGELQPDDLVWHRDLTDWQPAERVSGLFESGLHVRTAPPPLKRSRGNTASTIAQWGVIGWTGLFMMLICGGCVASAEWTKTMSEAQAGAKLAAWFGACVIMWALVAIPLALVWFVTRVKR